MQYTAYCYFFASFRHISISIENDDFFFFLFGLYAIDQNKREQHIDFLLIRSGLVSYTTSNSFFYFQCSFFFLSFFHSKWNTSNVHLSIVFNQLLLSVALYKRIRFESNRSIVVIGKSQRVQCKQFIKMNDANGIFISCFIQI